jgi:hypothetical protein
MRPNQNPDVGHEVRRKPRVVVELHSESHAAKPSTRAWAITRRAQRAHRRQADRQQRSDRAGRAHRTDRSHQPQERGVVADAR